VRQETLQVEHGLDFHYEHGVVYDGRGRCARAVECRRDERIK
jgi:hypothetical protein